MFMTFFSKGIAELMKLLYNTMEEACTSTPQYAGKLIYTVRNILALYEYVTPTVHASTLNTIPQHAALVHNNSFYLASHCNLLAHQYRPRLPAELRDGDPACIDYTDLTYKMTQLGTEVFCGALLRHKRELMSCIGNAQCAGEVASEVGVRQCMLHLQQLCNVWSDVLPYTVYNKTMS